MPRTRAIMSDSELYDKIFSGLKVHEREIVEGIQEKEAVEQWKHAVGAYLYAQGVNLLRDMMSAHMRGSTDWNPLSVVLSPYRLVDVDELKLFIPESLDDSSAKKKVS
ncbi:TPA_asm: hypothetical protein [Microviridae sp.]|nr:TPA_asm: hypothetical protein [Microviridae sp.]